MHFQIKLHKYCSTSVVLSREYKVESVIPKHDGKSPFITSLPPSLKPSLSSSNVPFQNPTINSLPHFHQPSIPPSLHTSFPLPLSLTTSHPPPPSLSPSITSPLPTHRTTAIPLLLTYGGKGNDRRTTKVLSPCPRIKCGETKNQF